MMKPKIYIGCCGFAMAQQKYFESFPVVEIQRTFYKLPELSTAQKWREAAPENFIFTMKAWQGVTHPASSPTYRKAKLEISEHRRAHFGFFQPTDEVFYAWESTANFAQALAAQVVILQTPPKFTQNDLNEKNLFNFFESIARPSFRIAIEFRSKWKSSVISNLCRQFDLIHCIDPFASAISFLSDIAYFRLHGSPPGERMYHYRYAQPDFEFLLQIIKNISDDAIKSFYFLFNNINMKEDALSFRKFLSAKLDIFQSQ